MDDEGIRNQWNSSTSFILVMVGAIIGLAGVWRFSYLIYENGGGSFLIPYILAIVIMVIPLLVLEFGVGFKYKASLPRIFYNIKSEFEIVAWFIIFLIFLVLIYYTCIMSWDLIYIVLSLFKGWGNNPSVFFTTTLLHSTSSPYGLTYLVVPIGIGLIAIWALIYFISRREINRGISLVTKFSLSLTFILVIILSIFALQLPGSRTGLMALFNPNWEYLLDFNIWLTAFGQLIFSYGLAYGIASTYSSYLPEDSKLIDSAWAIVLISLMFEILMSILIFALLGHMALGKHMAITSLVSDGFSLIFIVFPNVFNVMGSWAYVIGPAFFLVLFIGGLGALFALIEPLANAISEKFMWDKDRTIKTLVLVGLFSSFLFATGMGEYLLRIVDGFINQFAIILVVLVELIVFGWLFDINDIRNVLNNNSRIKLGKYWVYLIKFIIPVLLLVIWIVGLYNLIISGDRQSLLIQSILASIIVIVPLALTVIPFKGDYSLNVRTGYNYFKDSDDEGSSSKSKSKSDSKSDSRSRFKSKFESKNQDEKTYVEKTIDDFEDYDKDNGKDDFDEDDSSNNKSLFNWDKFKKSKNGKNVLNNVDLSSKEFDSPSDDDYDYDDTYQRYNSLDEDYNDEDDFDNKMNEYKSRSSRTKSKSKSDTNSSNPSKSKSLFEKINLFNKDHGPDNSDDGYNDYDDEDYFNISSDNDGFEDGFDDFDYIAPIREEKPKSKKADKKHKFRSSEEFDGIDSLDDLTLDEEVISKPKKKSPSGSKSKSKPKEKPKIEPKEEPKVEPKEEVEELEYEDFSDDFFDDGVFGDEGYEALLDDYVEKPKSNSKKQSKKDSSLESTQSNKGSKPQYDFEKKGSDSVFNLDD
ncbi:MAG: sodium-dependent transporter [Methanobrevibacter sp.]|nr:sodium-dependent transporter [Methanobrevibacter sp.]